MSARVAVRAIIVDGDKLFCVRHKAYGGKPEKAYWCTPGGGLEDNESLNQTVEREVMEEVGVRAKVGNLLYIQQYTSKDDGHEHLEFFFHVTNTEDFKNIDSKSASHHDIEIGEFGFIDRGGKKEIKPKFLGTEDIQAYIKAKDPTKIFNY